MIVDPAASDARGCAHTFQDPVLRVLIVARNGCHTLSTTNTLQTNIGSGIWLNILRLRQNVRRFPRRSFSPVTRNVCNRQRDALATEIRARTLHISLHECLFEKYARTEGPIYLSSSFLYVEEQQLKAVIFVF